MNHHAKTMGFGRILMGAGLLWGLLSSAHAQTDITPRSPAQSLSCLVKSAEAPIYPAQHEFDRRNGFVRVQLTFQSPDQAPQVKVLANVAHQRMLEEVERYVTGYRLPCWTPADGAVSAVQEFSFSNSETPPLPWSSGTNPAKWQRCLVMPRTNPSLLSQRGDRFITNTVLAISFSGGPDDPPEVSVLHSNAERHVLEESVRFARGYRMTCRQASDPIEVVQQIFTYRPAGVRLSVLTQDEFTLTRFLKMTANPEKLRGSFDFNTMSCPFKVRYTTYSPALPNEVEEFGDRNPNRALFVRWLAQLQLNFKDKRQANELFGTSLNVTVPCGRLELGPADETKAVE